MDDFFEDLDKDLNNNFDDTKKSIPSKKPLPKKPEFKKPEFKKEQPHKVNKAPEKTPVKTPMKSPVNKWNGEKTSQNFFNSFVKDKKVNIDTSFVKTPPKPVVSNNNNNNWSYQSNPNNSQQNNRFFQEFPEVKSYMIPNIQEDDARIIVIGWNNEPGKNMLALEYKNEIILLDSGNSISKSAVYGTKYCVPDISYLISRKKDIKALFITNETDNNILTLRKILPFLDFPPIYTTKLTTKLIKNTFENSWISEKLNLFEIKEWDNLNLSKFKFTFFTQNMNLPGSIGVTIELPNSKIVYSGNCNTPDEQKLLEIGLKKIDLLISNAINIPKNSSNKFTAELEEDIKNTRWRIIVSMFPNNLKMIENVINIGVKNKKNILFIGKNIQKILEIWKKEWFCDYDEKNVKFISQNIKTSPTDEYIIITENNSCLETSGIYKILKGEISNMKIQFGDTVILPSSQLSNTDIGSITLRNALTKTGVNILTNDAFDKDLPYNLSKEGQVTLLNTIKPRYYLPVMGDLFSRNLLKTIAVNAKFNKDNIFLVWNGGMIDLYKNGIISKNRHKIKIEDIFIDGQWLWNSSSHIIKDRWQMMKAGTLVVLFKIDLKSKAILGRLKLESRGMVYLNEVRDIHRMIIKKAKTCFEQTVRDVPDIDSRDLTKIIKSDLESFLLSTLGRQPMIIPVIMEV